MLNKQAVVFLNDSPHVRGSSLLRGPRKQTGDGWGKTYKNPPLLRQRTASLGGSSRNHPWNEKKKEKKREITRWTINTSSCSRDTVQVFSRRRKNKTAPTGGATAELWANQRRASHGAGQSAGGRVARQIWSALEGRRGGSGVTSICIRGFVIITIERWRTVIGRLLTINVRNCRYVLLQWLRIVSYEDRRTGRRKKDLGRVHWLTNHLNQLKQNKPNNTPIKIKQIRYVFIASRFILISLVLSL